MTSTTSEVVARLKTHAEDIECDAGGQRTPTSDTLSEAATLITTLVEANAELTAALKPFAVAAGTYDPEEEDDNSAAWQSVFNIGDLRKARSLLSTGGGNGR